MPDPEYHHNIELEESAQSRLSEPKRGLSPGAIVVLLGLVALPLLAMPFWLAQTRAPDNVDKNDDDEYLAPAGKVQLNLPPEEPAAAPAPAVQTSQSGEEAERERLAAEEARLAEERRALRFATASIADQAVNRPDGNPPPGMTGRQFGTHSFAVTEC